LVGKKEQDQVTQQNFQRVIQQSLIDRGLPTQQSLLTRPNLGTEAALTFQTAVKAVKSLETAPVRLRQSVVPGRIPATLTTSQPLGIPKPPSTALAGAYMKLSEGLPAYPPTTDFAVQREVMRKEAQDALAHAAVRRKAQYDQTHKPLRLTPGDLVFVGCTEDTTCQTAPFPKGRN
jgi:hypothetical protein